MSPSTSVVGGTATVGPLQANPRGSYLLPSDSLYANLALHASHHHGQLGLRRATAERCEGGLAVFPMERVAGSDFDTVSQATEVTMKNSLASTEFNYKICIAQGATSINVAQATSS